MDQAEEQILEQDFTNLWCQHMPWNYDEAGFDIFSKYYSVIGSTAETSTSKF